MISTLTKEEENIVLDLVKWKTDKLRIKLKDGSKITGKLNNYIPYELSSIDVYIPRIINIETNDDEIVSINSSDIESFKPINLLTKSELLED